MCILSKLKPKTSRGQDGRSMKLIKESIDHIIFPLARMINQSMSTGLVPKNRKIAKVIPILNLETNTYLTITDELACFLHGGGGIRGDADPSYNGYVSHGVTICVGVHNYLKMLLPLNCENTLIQIYFTNIDMAINQNIPLCILLFTH